MHLQLAEEWLLRSHEVLKNSYDKDAYASALKEAEQFLWAGSEMDHVSSNFRSELWRLRILAIEDAFTLHGL